MSIVAIAACLALLGIQLPSEDGQVQPAALHADASLAVAVQQAVAVSIPTQPNELPNSQKFVDAAASNNITSLEHKTREVEQLKAEIQSLRGGLSANPQISVRVEMLEVSLTKLQRMTTDFSDGRSYNGFGSTELAEFQKRLKTGMPISQPYTPPGIAGTTSFLGCLKENRIAKSLAEPSIVVVSGRPASFFVGGEIPIPNKQDSTAAVEFQKFGTEVDLLAIARDETHVRLELRARVSERDYSRSQKVNGIDIPALTVRQCDTAVEATFGEPVVLNGLVETRIDVVKTNAGIREEDNQIMLMVIVTPELVDPIDVGHEPISVPPSKSGEHAK